MKNSTILFLTTMVMLITFTRLASAAVYHTRDQALQLAFPGGDKVETINLFLTEEQVEKAARDSGAVIDSPIHTFYVGRKGDEITGYAAIEAATVRTLPQTVLVVLNPDRSLKFIEVLAFFEPEEYRPATRWLEQFRGRSLSPSLRIGGDIQGITGATLSAQAITRQARKTAALAAFLPGGN